MLAREANPLGVVVGSVFASASEQRYANQIARVARLRVVRSASSSDGAAGSNSRRRWISHHGELAETLPRSSAPVLDSAYLIAGGIGHFEAAPLAAIRGARNGREAAVSPERRRCSCACHVQA